MVGSLAMRPTALLYVARALRDFADGFVSVLLPVYLLALGFDALAVGVLATTALLGSSLLTFTAGLVGARYDHRQLLVGCASLMAATGVAFALVHDYAILLVIAFAGTVNPSSGNVSMFVPLEHAVLAGAVSDGQRTAAFARYSLFGALAAALGGLAAGLPDLAAQAGIDRLAALRAMFVLYAVLGIVGGLVYACLPREEPPSDEPAKTPLGPSRGIVYRLAGLFCIDAFAGGFTVQSLMALWLLERFDLSLTAAGLFFFWTGVFQAFSFPVAVWLSRRFGLVNTMVYTHIPSSLFLILAAMAPNLPVALAALLGRAALSQMDVPTRSSYVMAVVTPAERAAAASFTSVPRSLASSLSPALAGALLAGGYRAWPLVICGVLKIAYDLLLLRQFRHVKPPEEHVPAAGPPR